MSRVIVQGWRFLAHSYALVNQFQCLEMLRRPGLRLYHQDTSLLRPDWRPVRGIFDPFSEQQLADLAAPPLSEIGDVTYRIGFPIDLRSSRSPRTVVFATAETGLQSFHLLGGGSLREAMNRSDAIIATPSHWSRQRLIESGAEPARVAVVPHGVDPGIFCPSCPQRRAEVRRQAGCGENFVFLHVGAMSHNKALPLLLSAFAAVARRHPQALLALKGLDPIFPSQQLVESAASTLTAEQRTIVQPRIAYWGDLWPMGRMAELYNMADAYVSPYCAEAFNLPALEAAACGLPVICTAGGPTDDFVTPEFALRIDAQVIPVPGLGGGTALAPSLDSLVEHMLAVIEKPELRARARTAGPAHVARAFTWKISVDRLLEVLLPGKYPPAREPLLESVLPVMSKEMTS